MLLASLLFKSTYLTLETSLPDFVSSCGTVTWTGVKLRRVGRLRFTVNFSLAGVT